MDQNEVDEFLEHHGVKGMRWGVRRNVRNLQTFSRAAAPGASKAAKAKAFIGPSGLTLPELVRAKGSVTAASKNRVDAMLAQKARVESGKATVLDKLGIIGKTSVLDIADTLRGKS